MLESRCQRYQLRLLRTRATSLSSPRLYSVIHAPSVETIQVTCGSSGHVILKIHNHHHLLSSSTAPLIIHIPPLPLLSALTTAITATNHELPVPPALLATNTTVIQILPRWSPPTHLFPTPIHDLLYAYTHLLTTLLPAPPLSPFTRARPRPIALYASHLSASLATALALTECRVPSPSPTAPAATIAALAVKDAIFDWSRIATTSPPPSPLSPALSGGRHGRPLDAAALYALRSMLFRNPASAFDAFASPMLFFRTTGLAIPAVFPESGGSGDGDGDGEGATAQQTYVARKSHLKFPPKRSGLRIPVTRIGVTDTGAGTGGGKEGDQRRKGRKGVGKGKKGEGKSKESDEGGDGELSEDLLREQAEEMVMLMRRSVILHEGKERRDNMFDGVAEAERRVALVELEGLHGKSDDEDDAEWAAEFFREVLGTG